jgi:hypothetical protein
MSPTFAMAPDLVESLSPAQPIIALQGLPSPLTIRNRGSQALASAQAATLEHLATIAGGHTLTKAMHAQALAHFGLICSLGHRKDRTPFFSRTLALPQRVESLFFVGARKQQKNGRGLEPPLIRFFCLPARMGTVCRTNPSHYTWP